MRTLTIIAAVFILLVGVACGDEKAAPTKFTPRPPTPLTHPAERLWGTWDYVGAELSDRVMPYVQEHFRDRGVAPDQIDEAVADYTDGLMDGFVGSMVFYRPDSWSFNRGVVAFVKDNEDYFGGGAAYFVEGDLIAIYGQARTVWWSMTGDVLTITFMVYEFRELIQTDEDRAPIDKVIRRLSYRHDPGFRVILKRRT